MSADLHQQVERQGPYKLLVVEDEHHLSMGLKMNFELEGYLVDVAATARDAIRALATSEPHDLIVLDVMLPDLSGIELCRKLRHAGNHTPIIMLTARRATDDRVEGLEAGADDYMLKPFELSELLARVKGLLRRRRWERGTWRPVEAAASLTFGRAAINFDTYEATVAGAPLKLTRLEVDLLRYFAKHAGRVISREELLTNVWEVSHQLNTRSVDNFIVRLRRHFEVDPANPQHFISVRGAGYRFDLGAVAGRGGSSRAS
jgi:DNA-binding response OmpR family regulator